MITSIPCIEHGMILSHDFGPVATVEIANTFHFVIINLLVLLCLVIATYLNARIEVQYMR